MEFRILGPLEAIDDTGPLALTRGRQKALLALLLLRQPRHPAGAARRRPLGRGRAGDHDQDGADLRLAPPQAATAGPDPDTRTAIDWISRVSLDLRTFEALEARDVRHSRADTQEAVALLRGALELWRGAARGVRRAVRPARRRGSASSS